MLFFNIQDIQLISPSNINDKLSHEINTHISNMLIHEESTGLIEQPLLTYSVINNNTIDLHIEFISKEIKFFNIELIVQKIIPISNVNQIITRGKL